MPIQPGDPIPEARLQRIDEGVEIIDTPTLFNGKNVVLFAVPGAFTPTCSEKHLPGFIQHFDEFRKRGIEVLCMSVNDPFVMQAWGLSQLAPEGLQLLADGNGEFARALGLEMVASAYGMGMRAKRFSLYAEDGVARIVNVEAPGEFRVSSAEHLLSQLP
jgi:peroxiredoxin